MLNFTIFSDNLDYALGWMVVHSLWQATLIAIVSGVIMIALRKKSAKLRYIIANISLFMVLIVAILTFFWHYDFNPTPTNIVSNATLNIVEGDNIPTGLELNENTEGVKTSLLNFTTFKTYFNNHLPLIVTVWALGVALFLLRLLGSVSYIYYLKSRMNFPTDEYWTDMIQSLSKRAGLKQAVDLVESAMVRTPVVVGHLKPMILFPMGIINRLSTEEVEAILAHELAHVLRHDYLFNILQSVVEALFYYHPAVWWLSNQIRNERESACDDIAIKLINSKMNYAKALVTIQEMAYYPISPALGFAGQQKNQFVMRMHRILNIQQNKTNVMEKLIATLLIVCTLFGLAYGQQQQDKPQKTDNISQNDDTFIQISDSDRPLSMKGVWQGEIKGNEVCIVFNNNLKGGNWSSTECFGKSEFSSLPTQEQEFTVTRAAGTMKMKGKFEQDNDGYGRFEFVPNTEFRTYMEGLGIANLKESTLLHCFFADMNKDFIGFLKEKGYNNLTRKNIEELAIFRMDKKIVNNYLDLFKKAGNNNPSLNKLVELKIHGVDDEYINSLQKYGYIDVPINQILEAKIHGIGDDYLQTFAQHKSKKYSLKDLIEMKIHGADGDYITKIEGNTGKILDADDVVNAKIHNIDKVEVDKIEKSVSNKLTTEDIQNFAIHGIDADYINKVNAMGLGKLSNDDIIAAKIHGITPEFIQSYTALGFKKLDFDNILSAKIHGIDANFVQRFKTMGFDVKFDDVMAAKIHGLTPEFMQQLKQSGFTDVSFDDALSFKIHAISPQFVKDFKDMGFKDASMDDLMACKIHNVTPQYIKSFEPMGIKNLDIEDAIAFKIHGVTPEFVKSLKDNGYSIDTDDVLNKKIRGSKGGSRSIGSGRSYSISTPSPLEKGLPDLDFDNKGNKAHTWFIKTLKDEGYIQLNKPISIKFREKGLTIDDKNLSDAIFQKYKKGVESQLGKKLKNNFRYIFEGTINRISDGGIEVDGNLVIDID